MSRKRRAVGIAYRCSGDAPMLPPAAAGPSAKARAKPARIALDQIWSNFCLQAHQVPIQPPLSFCALASATFRHREGGTLT